MRQPFNDTCDIYAGPGASVPGQFVGTFACRFVIEDAIRPSNPGIPDIIAYLTIEGFNPRGCFAFPGFAVDTDLADRVDVLSRPSAHYWVIYSDQIDWYSQGPYYRAYLCTLPVPPILPAGGVSLGGSALVSMSRVVPVSGGVRLGGAAAWSSSHDFVPSGGVLLGGAASWAFTPGVTDYIRDTFTDTSGTGIASHTPEVGGPWTNRLGTCQVIGNSFQSASYSSGSAWASIDIGRTDYTLTVDFVVPVGQSYLTSYPLVLIRCTDASNTWYVYFFNGFFYLECYVAGAVTRSTVVNPLLMPGNTYTIMCVVTAAGGIDVYCNGSHINDTTATWASVTTMGLYLYSASGVNVGVKYDNLLVVP